MIHLEGKVVGNYYYVANDDRRGKIFDLSAGDLLKIAAAALGGLILAAAMVGGASAIPEGVAATAAALGLNPKWQSNKTFGHTFDHHGKGKSRKNLQGRANSLDRNGKKMGPQGRWLDNQKAANVLIEALANLESNINFVQGKAVEIDIPPGLGEVIKPDGSVVPATKARIVPDMDPKAGPIKTAFPILD